MRRRRLGSGLMVVAAQRWRWWRLNNGNGSSMKATMAATTTQ
jgi:hypothetical protein